VSARHEALALGLRRKDGTGALLAARDRLTGLLGPAAELLTVTPGYEVPVAAAFGAAADAVVVDTPGSAAEAIRLLRKQDAGRAALLLAGENASSGAPGAPAVPDPAGGVRDGAGPPPVADLVRGPAELMGAVRRLLHGIVVVPTLEEAEDLVHARPELTAVTSEGDLLGSHFAHGGSAGAPSLMEVQASVDEAAAELAELDTRCEELSEAQRTAREHRRQCQARLEELTEQRRAADREKSSVAQQLGRLAGQARGAAGEAERAAAAAERAQEALERATAEAEELAERLAVAEESAGQDEEPDTSLRDRLAADGANARQTEMEARLQVRTHEERVKGLAGRADSLDRAARAEREARVRAEQRRARLQHEAAVARAGADGARKLLALV
jgi:chromosome segregation protein